MGTSIQRNLDDQLRGSQPCEVVQGRFPDGQSDQKEPKKVFELPR